MTDYIESLDTVNDITLNGTKLKDLITGTGLVSCDFDADATMASQIEFSYVDPGFEFTKRKGKFKIGDLATFQGYTFQVSRATIGDQSGQPLVTVSLRSDVIRKLKELQGAKSIQNASPTQFISTELASIGVKGVLQPSPRRNTVSRDVQAKGESKRVDPNTADNEYSSWTTFQRLATETGYMMFENSGVIYFGQSKWLVARDSNPITACWGQSAFDSATGKKAQVFNVPSCSASVDSKINEVSVEIASSWYKQLQPGQALKLAGIPGFAATYLIMSVKYSMIGTKSITVTAQTPINQVPQKGAFADGSRLI